MFLTVSEQNIHTILAIELNLIMLLQFFIVSNQKKREIWRPVVTNIMDLENNSYHNWKLWNAKISMSYT